MLLDPELRLALLDSRSHEVELTKSEPFIVIAGGCHCQAIRWKACLASPIRVQDCNCSICDKAGFLHILTPADQFQLVSGLDDLAVYRWNTGLAAHLFCRICGVKSFYRPRSNPNGWSLNARCVVDRASLSLIIEPFDGQNWEENAAHLADLA